MVCIYEIVSSNVFCIATAAHTCVSLAVARNIKTSCASPGHTMQAPRNLGSLVPRASGHWDKPHPNGATQQPF
jgi:hypothetical protein